MREYLRPDGTRRWLVLGADADPDCQNQRIPVSVDSVRWLGLIPAGKTAWLGRGIVLQGSEQSGQQIRISEVEVAGPPEARRRPLPIEENLLVKLNARTFGVEERATASLSAHGLELECRRGRRPAGVALRNDRVRLPAGIETALNLTYQADAQFGIGYADGERHRLDTPRQVGRLESGSVPPGDWAAATLPLPSSSSPGPVGNGGFTLVLSCPLGDGNATLSNLYLSAGVSQDRPARSVWIWQPSEWLAQPDPLLEELVALETLLVYVSVPISRDRVTHPEILAAFIEKAAARGVSVWAVEGDPHAVLPDGRAGLLRRAKALSRFNRDQPEERRLSGVQYDIEPYLLPDFAIHAEDWLAAYVQTIEALDGVLSMPLEIAVPFWWSELTLNGQRLLDHLAGHVQSVNVMNYRTDPGQLQQFAEPFLAWGVARGIPVRIALEAGPIPDEDRWHYQPAGEGTLWHLEMGAEHLLVLLRNPAIPERGSAYRLVRRSRFEGRRLTFAGDRARMTGTMTRLEGIWSAWPSFAGLALHEYRLPEDSRAQGR